MPSICSAPTPFDLVALTGMRWNTFVPWLHEMDSLRRSNLFPAVGRETPSCSVVLENDSIVRRGLRPQAVYFKP
jgi:hypothetical protein